MKVSWLCVCVCGCMILTKQKTRREREGEEEFFVSGLFFNFFWLVES